MNKCVWMYWENRPGSTKSAYLELCIDTIKRHLGDYQLMLLDEKTVLNYIDIPPIVDKLKHLAHKADYIRYQLLYKYGGIWLDSDVILLQDIGLSVEPYINDYDYIGCGTEQGKPSIWFMAAQPGCQLLAKQIEKVELALKFKFKKRWLKYLVSGQLELGWGAVGYDSFWPLAKDYPYYHHPFNTFAPTICDDWKIFFDEHINLNDYLKEEPLAVMLYNQFMGDSLKNYSKDELLQGKTLLSKLFRKALDLQ